MLPIDGLAYRRTADVAIGNLIYAIGDTAELGICIGHPPGTAGGQITKAVLRLGGTTKHGRMPIVDTGISRCIDWGRRPEVRWTHPISLAPRNSQVPLAPGYLVLVGDRPSLSSQYTGGRGDTMYWNVLTGDAVTPGQSDFIFVTEWKLGVTGGDGHFVQLASYPDDYGPTQAQERQV
jgi:hypothetical protein